MLTSFCGIDFGTTNSVVGVATSELLSLWKGKLKQSQQLYFTHLLRLYLDVKPSMLILMVMRDVLCAVLKGFWEQI